MRLTKTSSRRRPHGALPRRRAVQLGLAGALAALLAVTALRSFSRGAPLPAPAPPSPPAGPRTLDWLILLVQGTAEHVYRWQAIAAAGVPHVTLIYASYDAPAPGGALYLPNSTWTQGRNALARAAGCEEARRGARAKYWIFADDDVVLRCAAGGAGPCWEAYFRHLRRATAPTVALRYDNQLMGGYGGGEAWLTDSYDSILNAVRRDDAAPVLLPYVETEDAQSWWAAQALHFRVMRACFPEMAAVPAAFAYQNPQHREYPRGRDAAAELAAVSAAYEPYGGLPPSQAVQEPFDQFAHVSGPHDPGAAAELLAAKWETFRGGACPGLGRRFQELVLEAGCAAK